MPGLRRCTGRRRLPAGDGLSRSRPKEPPRPRYLRGVAYDAGGPLKPGYTLAYNGTGSDERILTHPQWATAAKAINQVAGGGAAGTVNLDISLTGDGPITQAMVDTAVVQIDHGMRQLKRHRHGPRAGLAGACPELSVVPAVHSAKPAVP